MPKFTYELIEAIETEAYRGLVYNLETETEEYVTEGIVVHNCPHYWHIRPEQVHPDVCPQLWMGE